MQEKWLPGTLRDRIRDLCRSKSITQTELAQALSIDKSTLSRFMTEKTNKLSSEYVVAIANYFEVSTDFLLGLTHSASRKNYDVEKLGLTVEAAANLYHGRLNRSVVCQLLENPKFAALTQQIALYQEGVMAVQNATQNEIYNVFGGMLLENADPEHLSAAKATVRETSLLKVPLYANELDNLTRSFRQILSEMKADGPEKAKQAAALNRAKLEEIASQLPIRQGDALAAPSPEQILAVLANALKQISIPAKYQAEFNQAVETLMQAIYDYLMIVYRLQKEADADSERNALPDDSEWQS